MQNFIQMGTTAANAAAGEGWSTARVALAVGLVAAITALFGHFVAWSNARLQAALARENARLQTKLSANVKLAEMRQAWINSLRDDMSAFQSLGVTPGLDQQKEREFYRLGTRIELFMNPDDEDFEELSDCLYEFLTAKTVDEKYSANPQFVEVCQRILKREWDKLKLEVESVAKFD
jgi:hypothetical protein